MYIIGGFDGQRLNDMYHIALPMNADEKQNMSLARRRASARPFSSTSGFMQSYLSDVGGGSAQSSAESD